MKSLKTPDSGPSNQAAVCPCIRLVGSKCRIRRVTCPQLTFRHTGIYVYTQQHIQNLLAMVLIPITSLPRPLLLQMNKPKHGAPAVWYNSGTSHHDKKHIQNQQSYVSGHLRPIKQQCVCQHTVPTLFRTVPTEEKMSTVATVTITSKMVNSQ
jgi:hypothetical protein